jgi:hypothetical protein
MRESGLYVDHTTVYGWIQRHLKESPQHDHLADLPEDNQPYDGTRVTRLKTHTILKLDWLSCFRQSFMKDR